MESDRTSSVAWPPPPPQRTLPEILASAATHMVYAPLLSTSSPGLSDFPPLRKAQLLGPLNARMALRGAYVSPTGGTMTDATVMYVPNDAVENRMHRHQYASLLRATGALGADSVVLNLHGGQPMYRSGDLTSSMIEYAGGTELPATSNATPAQAAEIAARFGANTLFAGGSKLMELARWAETHPLPGLHTALFTSEPLSPTQEAYVRATLGIKFLGSVYGSAECGPVGVSPPAEATEGARVFVVDRAQFVVETIDPDGNVLSSSLDPPGSPGAAGELLFTSLTRHRFPVVRYRSGDFGRIFAHANPAWLSLELHGRDRNRSFNVGGDYIELSEIEDRVLASLAGEGILEWQVIVDQKSEVEFRVVFDGGEHEERAKPLHDALNREIFHGFHEFHFTVRAVGYGDLVRGKMARKVRRVVDLRE